MKILHCLHQYHPATGGAEWLMKNVSERLAAVGHSVRIIATNARSVEDYFVRGKGKNLMRAGEEEVDGIPVRRMRFTRRGAALLNLARAAANRLPLPFGDRLRMLSWGPRSRAYYREIIRSIRAGEVDLVAACPLPTLNVYYAWKAARRSGVPFVMVPCFHTEDVFTFHNRIYFSMMRAAAAIICLTEWEKSFLLKATGAPEEVFQVIGAGIDMPNVKTGGDGESSDRQGAEKGAEQAGINSGFAGDSHASNASAKIPRGESLEKVSSVHIRQKYGISVRDFVLFLGQHAPHKGIITLIEAMKSVWREKPETGLVIAGNPTAHTRDVEARIRCLSDDEQRRVCLIGKFPESDKRDIMAACRVFVSVSPFESFGIVFLEAWREKKSVIGCRRGASSKIINEFRDGLLVPDRDREALAGAILELLENGLCAERMGEAGYRKAAARYSWDNIIARWEKVYESVLQR